MIIGLFLLLFGTVETVWMTWRIRNYRADPNKVSALRAFGHDVLRTAPRPTPKWLLRIDSYSSWYGLVGGLVMIGLGLILTLVE